MPNLPQVYMPSELVETLSWKQLGETPMIYTSVQTDSQLPGGIPLGRAFTGYFRTGKERSFTASESIRYMWERGGLQKIEGLRVLGDLHGSRLPPPKITYGQFDFAVTSDEDVETLLTRIVEALHTEISVGDIDIRELTRIVIAEPSEEGSIIHLVTHEERQHIDRECFPKTLREMLAEGTPVFVQDYGPVTSVEEFRYALAWDFWAWNG